MTIMENNNIMAIDFGQPSIPLLQRLLGDFKNNMLSRHL